jgi:hypothetical protein
MSTVVRVRRVAAALLPAHLCAKPTAPGQSAPIRRVWLLGFERLPSCFIVNVAGGRANGRTVRGSFRAQARNQSDQIMSVLVTPMSTLTYAVRRAALA